METQKLELIDLIIYRGKNIYSHRPIMKMIVDIGEYQNIPTKDIEGFNGNLLKAFPNLKKNTCGLGYEGGFMERLEEGTYLAHVLEHVVLDIQNTLGYNVKFGKTRLLKEPSRYYLVYEYENEICALECGKAALFILNCFLEGQAIEINEFLEYLERIRLDSELGPSTSAIVNEAKRRGIPVTRIGYESLVRLGYGKHNKLIESTLSDTTSCISADISSNKQLTKSILDEHKIPVPYGKVVFSELSAVMVANQIGLPVVIKPLDGNQGKGVHLNLTREADIRAAFQEASKYSAGIIVEKFVTGNDYRILVVGGQVKAVAQRLPALVVGDGQHTIAQLVDIINSDDARGENHEKSLTKIRLKNVEHNVLMKKGLDDGYVPQKGETVTLRENGNLSTGGTAIDCTASIHPDNANIAINASNAIGIDIAGIDFVAEDISRSILSSSGAVIEVNAAPGIRMHLYPSEGNAHNVAKDIVDFLFPDESMSDLPIVSVTGTNGKTTTVRLVSYILTLTGKTVGTTSTCGTHINEKCVCKGDNSGPTSAGALLANKSIDVAVLETARGGIIRQGLGYDLADVGIITNVTEDHLGMNGIDTVEELAFVKALVVEAIKPGGYAVLNAEDAMTEMMLKRVKSKVILFHKTEISPELLQMSAIHVFVRDGMIKIKDGHQIIDIMKVADVPITLNGLLECNIDNCLAAVSALYALKIPINIISKGLKSFENNPGRFQLIDKNSYQVMLDYAHNPAGYEEMIKFCKKMNYKRLIGVIGMPGDRPNAAIKAVGALCGGAFDQIFIKEDKDLRGRDEQEVANLLYDSIKDSSFDEQNLKIIRDEADALKEVVSNATNGDLIVVLYEKLEPLLDILERTGINQQKRIHPVWQAAKKPSGSSEKIS